MEIISEGINYFLYLSIPVTLLTGVSCLFLPYSKQSRLSFALLLLFFGLALIRITLMHIGWMAENPTAYFLPVWYTLFFGVLLFYGVKMRLFPEYRLRFTDAKHFLLPALQALFFWMNFGLEESEKLELLQDFIPTFYKPLEGALFIILYFSYMIMAFRYVKYKQAVLKKREQYQEVEKLDGMRHMIKVLFFLGGINTSYILMDFFSWQFFHINLYTVRGFGSLNDLSFVAMALWLSWFVLSILKGRSASNK